MHLSVYLFRNKCCKIVFAMVFLAVSGCTSTPSVTEQTLIHLYAKQRRVPKKRPIIFVPGIMGSILEDRTTGKTKWGRGLAGRMDALALPVDGVRVSENRDNLIANSPLSKIAWIPGLVEVSVYSKIREMALSSGGYTADIDAFSLTYDWRLDFIESVKRLDALITRIKEGSEEPDLKIDILTHSAGGLIARYYVKYGAIDVIDIDPMPPPTYAGASNIGQVIMLAPPNLGSFEAFQRIHDGLHIPFVGEITPDAAFTMPFLYQLLPHDGKVFINKEGKSLSLDLYDHTNWLKYGWSVFNSKRLSKVRRKMVSKDAALGFVSFESYKARQLRFLRNALDRAGKFHSALWNGDLEEEQAKTRYVVLGSNCRDTISRGLIYAYKGRWGVRFNSRNKRIREQLFSMGDESVSKESLIGMECDDSSGVCESRFPSDHTVFVCEAHTDVTKSPTYMDNVLHALLD